MRLQLNKIKGSNSIEMIADFDTLEDFYTEALTFKETGNSNFFEKETNKEDKAFVGLSKTEVQQYKYSYPFECEPIDLDIFGHSHIEKFYSDDDGCDLNYDRMLDGFSPMVNYHRVTGTNTGKFMTIHVNVSENCFVDSKDMLNKAKYVVSLADSLENNGIRTKIIVHECSKDPGKYVIDGDEKTIARSCINIVIKDFNEPLIIQNIYTAISSWMLRYWLFCFQTSIMHPSYGYGSADSLKSYLKEESSDEYIIIDSGECLNNKECKVKTNELLVKFGRKKD
jgi:hypothetical protein